jgi:hypothetical protein
LSGREALLKGLILGLPRSINKKPAKQTRACADSGTEPGIARDCTDCRTASGADGRTGQRSLLGWTHIGASTYRQSERRNYQISFHDVLRPHSINLMVSTGIAR